MFSGGLSPTHWLIVAVVVVLLFGSKKLPDTARSLGRSLRIFKAETTKLHEPEPSIEEQARELEDRAAQLRAQGAEQRNQQKIQGPDRAQ
ncbi:Sec-independent protein translocase subunit TatA [Streptosporangium sp. NPDC087985]|uniref:Sec-independent protein translocase subunit TatA n=1 Tax=Streptosporangium sp. NPDC087985 TaxID=3366196 RepID=UPI00381BA45A